jgi:hypothetical protein
MEQPTNNLVFDLILLEADRVLAHKRKDLDLYYRDDKGNYHAIAEAYEAQAEEISRKIYQRKKLKYFITFQEGIDIQDELMPSANKILRFFSKAMTYGNKVTGYSLRDIQACTGLNMKYVLLALKCLTEKDVVRFSTHRQRRTYMVNPVYMYKGTLKKLFYCVQTYSNMPSVALDGSDEYINEFE